MSSGSSEEVVKDEEHEITNPVEECKKVRCGRLQVLIRASLFKECPSFKYNWIVCNGTALL